MPQLMIPRLGDRIRLKEDWHFIIYWERRNEKLLKQCDMKPPFLQTKEGMYTWRQLELAERRRLIDESVWTHEAWDPANTDLWSGKWHTPFVLREDTELIVDRYYIRNHMREFDSLTFRSNCWMSALGDPLFTKKYVNGRKVPSIRFWAKLEDVNKIVGDLL